MEDTDKAYVIYIPADEPETNGDGSIKSIGITMYLVMKPKTYTFSQMPRDATIWKDRKHAEEFINDEDIKKQTPNLEIMETTIGRLREIHPEGVKWWVSEDN